MPVDRRHFMAYFSAMGLGSTLFPGVLYARLSTGAPISTETIAHAEQIAGVSFTDAEREMMVEDLQENLKGYEVIRTLSMPNSVAPALVFDLTPAGAPPPSSDASMGWEPRPVERPQDDEDLAFLPVADLAYLLKTRQVTSMELTGLYLSRLRKYDGVLQAVVSYTEDRAWEQAKQADRELDAGQWRGPLHGVPYGAKDLLATRGALTTWGATPYREQLIDVDAAVIEKLDAAGAVLLAKLSLGALAWGDVWFGGTTKNPWNVEQGASGSSAGPGAAVAAGLVGFAIGSETYGSIVSPSTRNGITGFRPTFGLVSRYGAMALSWSMDKLGPMARTAEDCALVFEAIRGRDPRDPSTVDAPFPYRSDLDVKQLRVGYYANAFEADYPNRAADQAALDVLRSLGVDLHPIELPTDLPVEAMLVVLTVEAGAAFDELTRTRGIDQMVRQTRDAWPHVFRTSRFIPAVEYVQANRARTLLMQRMAEALQQIDVFVAPAFEGGTLAITNLTGHPCVCVPNAFHPAEGQGSASRRRSPGSITFVGNVYRDAETLALAHAYQQATTFHRQRPSIQ